MNVLVDAFQEDIERSTIGVNIQTPLCYRM